MSLVVAVLKLCAWCFGHDRPQGRVGCVVTHDIVLLACDTQIFAQLLQSGCATGQAMTHQALLKTRR
jgi:hypothetical protein